MILQEKAGASLSAQLVLLPVYSKNATRFRIPASKRAGSWHGRVVALDRRKAQRMQCHQHAVGLVKKHYLGASDAIRMRAAIGGHYRIIQPNLASSPQAD